MTQQHSAGEVERMTHSPVRVCVWQTASLRTNECTALCCRSTVFFLHLCHTLTASARALLPMSSTVTSVTHEQPLCVSQSTYRRIPGQPMWSISWRYLYPSLIIAAFHKSHSGYGNCTRPKSEQRVCITYKVKESRSAFRLTKCQLALVTSALDASVRPDRQSAVLQWAQPVLFTCERHRIQEHRVCVCGYSDDPEWWVSPLCVHCYDSSRCTRLLLWEKGDYVFIHVLVYFHSLRWKSVAKGQALNVAAVIANLLYESRDVENNRLAKFSHSVGWLRE